MPVLPHIHYQYHTLPEQTIMFIFPMTTPYTRHAHRKPSPEPPFSFWHCSVLLLITENLISSSGTLKLYRKQRRQIYQVSGTHLILPRRTESASLCWESPYLFLLLPHIHSSPFPSASKYHFHLLSRFLCQSKHRLLLLAHLPNSMKYLWFII